MPVDMKQERASPDSNFHSIVDEQPPKKSSRATGVCGAAPMIMEPALGEEIKKERYMAAVPMMHPKDEYFDRKSVQSNKNMFQLENISEEDKQIESQVMQIMKKDQLTIEKTLTSVKSDIGYEDI